MYETAIPYDVLAAAEAHENAPDEVNNEGRRSNIQLLAVGLIYLCLVGALAWVSRCMAVHSCSQTCRKWNVLWSFRDLENAFREAAGTHGDDAITETTEFAQTGDGGDGDSDEDDSAIDESGDVWHVVGDQDASMGHHFHKPCIRTTAGKKSIPCFMYGSDEYPFPSIEGTWAPCYDDKEGCKRHHTLMFGKYPFIVCSVSEKAVRHCGQIVARGDPTMPTPDPSSGSFPQNPYYRPSWSGTGCRDSAACISCFATPRFCPKETYATCSFERAWCQSPFGLISGQATSWINMISWVIFLTSFVVYCMQPSRVLVPAGPLRSWGLSLDALRILVSLAALVLDTIATAVATAYSVPVYLLPNPLWANSMSIIYSLGVLGHILFLGLVIAAYIHAAAHEQALPAAGNVPMILTPAWLVFAATCFLATKTVRHLGRHARCCQRTAMKCDGFLALVRALIYVCTKPSQNLFLGIVLRY